MKRVEWKTLTMVRLSKIADTRSGLLLTTLNMEMMIVTDNEAMDELERWIIDNDPVLDGSHPNWVWDLLSVVDDILAETGRV